MIPFFRARTHVTSTTTADETALNIRYLYLEILFACMLSAIVLFNGAFAVRLGASNELIALLTAVPPLVSALFSVPSARFLRRRKNQRRWIFGSLFALRIGYGVIAIMPFVFTQDTAAWLTLWLILLSLPAILFTNGFQALLAELIPEHKRALVFSRRQIIWAVGVVFTSALAGAWLDGTKDAFPLNYQLMYIFGFITVQGSTWYLGRLKIPNTLTQATPTVALPRAGQAQSALNTPLRRMLLNMVIYNFGLNFGGALFNIYYIKVLGAPDSWLGLNTAAGFAGMVAGYLVWERLLRRHSFQWALRRAALLTWIFPVGIALVPNVYFIMITNFIVNMIHPGVDLSVLNLTMKLATTETRTVAMSWYNAVLNGMAFLAPLMGTAFAGPFGIPAAFLASGVLRTIGGALFTLNPADEPRDPNATPTPDRRSESA